MLATSSRSPSAGEPFSLQCSLNGTSDRRSAIFQWLKGPADNMTQLTSDDSTTINSTSSVSQLLFSPLRASHGGLYTCQATVLLGAVNESATVNVNCKCIPISSFLIHGVVNLITIIMQYYLSVPAPTSVVVTPPVYAIIAGSSPNLTCTVELSPAVDVPVTLNTEWTGPVLTTVTPTNLMMENVTRYIATAMVDAARNGSYTCQATVSSSSQFTTGGGSVSATTNITVGMCCIQSCVYMYVYCMQSNTALVMFTVFSRI